MKLLSERLAYIHQEMPELEGERGQTGLIRASGASKSVVNQWVTDKIKSMDIKYALNIERNLGFSHIWLMTGDGEPRLSPRMISGAWADPYETKLETADELRLLAAYRMANERERADIEIAASSVRRRLASNESNKG